MATATKTKRPSKRQQEQEAKDSRRQSVASDLGAMVLLGEIITWDVAAKAVAKADVIDALKANDLDEKLVKEFMIRHAFNRACKSLAEERIIQIVNEEGEFIYFQFSTLADDREYEVAPGKKVMAKRLDVETMLRLNKSSGNIECPKADLVAIATKELARCQDERTAGDITKIVQRLFDQQADLFPIRRNGGAYFVPISYQDFLSKIEGFLQRLGGTMNRFPVPAGTPHGDKSVKESVAEGIAGMIEDHLKAVAAFGEETRETTLEGQAEKIKRTRFKIDAYATYLDDEAQKLRKALEDASTALKARVALLGECKEANATVDCDHCNAPNPLNGKPASLVCRACRKTFEIDWS